MTFYFFFNEPATTEIYPLPLHDALPICHAAPPTAGRSATRAASQRCPSEETKRASSRCPAFKVSSKTAMAAARSEEHTSELQSRQYLVCRLLLEKKNK